MSILRKPLSEITVSDLQDLIDAEARETGELEFKGALPFQTQKGQSQTADRWIEKGDRVGDYARDEILAELVAFANADGGTLVLGLHETKDEPRRAERLEALPNCIGLARRLLDASEDIVEPRLRSIDARALPVDGTEKGYVVIRVGKSPAGPHRLKSTREFHVRRGERAVKMDVREIKDLTLELARTGDRIEQMFLERRAEMEKIFAELMKQPTRNGFDPLIARVTAAPISQQQIPDVTARDDLWWTGQEFKITIGDEGYECSYPAWEFARPPEVRLRSLITSSPRDESGSHRLLRGDGLVEFSLVHPKSEPRSSGARDSRIYVSWLMCILVGALAQVHQIRTKLAWDGVEFGMEIEIQATPPLSIRWDDYGWSERTQVKVPVPLLLPRYSIGAGVDFDSIINAVVSDLFNSTGRNWSKKCSVPWADLL
jgi:Putative DNA-binding domain